MIRNLWFVLLMWLAGYASASTSPNQQVGKTRQAPVWISMTVGWNNGTVAPPYRKSGSMMIKADESILLTQLEGYDPKEPNKTKLVHYQAEPKALADLLTRLESLGAFNTNWQAAKDPPVGGSQRFTSIELKDRIIAIPSYAETAAQRERAAQIFAAISGLPKTPQ
jgi:hypothetical protein